LIRVANPLVAFVTKTAPPAFRPLAEAVTVVKPGVCVVVMLATTNPFPAGRTTDGVTRPTFSSEDVR